MKKSSLRASGATALALTAGAFLALAAPLSASAHVSASATSTAAGSFTIVTFSVPHGCEGSPTTEIAIEIPASILSVTPTVNPAWTVEKVAVPLEEATEDSHGEEVTERTGEVVYATLGDGLPDGYRDTFELSLQLPDGEAGDVVEFPVRQTCVEGEVAWTGDDVPAITLTAATEDGDHHGGGTGESAESGAGGDDVLARVLGVSGLVVGAVGIVLAVVSRRRASSS